MKTKPHVAIASGLIYCLVGGGCVEWMWHEHGVIPIVAVIVGCLACLSGLATIISPWMED